MARGLVLVDGGRRTDAASKRPYVGSSTNNTELGLTFEYNGFGRVEGQVGGPGAIPVRRWRARARCTALSGPAPGALPIALAGEGSTARRARPSRRRARPSSAPEQAADPVRRPTGTVAAVRRRLGDQGAWMLPFALFGLLGGRAR